MEKETESIIRNRELRDSGGKLIFGDNTLSSQFFRDYADMDILRNIKPEDVEDVSARYVPLYSTERDSDSVKRVDISKYLNTKEVENPLGLPLYIVSLVEHKTKVEYNVNMQILRYVIHIWEDYEKEMDKRIPYISASRDFRYPPILPIVYFEGKGKWTAAQDVADRIFCGELLGKYLPHFRYQLVKLHDYSNEALLAKRDEISLAMLINKIQSPEDMTSFAELPGGELDEILEDTPDHLLELLAKLLRALLYSMRLSENVVEDVVGKIKERRMGRLFENQTIDFEALRCKAEQAQKEWEQTERKREQAEKEREQAEKEREQAEKEREQAEKERDAAYRENEIYRRINKKLMEGAAADEIRETVVREFSMTEEEVRKIFND